MQLQPQIRHVAFHTVQAELHCWGSSRVMDSSWLHSSQCILPPRYIGSTCNKQQYRLSSQQRRCKHEPPSAHWIHRYYTQMDKKADDGCQCSVLTGVWHLLIQYILREACTVSECICAGTSVLPEHCITSGLLSTTCSGDGISYNCGLHKTATTQIDSESNFRTILPGDVWDQADANSFTGLLNCIFID